MAAINVPIPEVPPLLPKESWAEADLNQIQHKADKAKRKTEEEIMVKLVVAQACNEETSRSGMTAKTRRRWLRIRPRRTDWRMRKPWKRLQR